MFKFKSPHHQNPKKTPSNPSSLAPNDKVFLHGANAVQPPNHLAHPDLLENQAKLVNPVNPATQDKTDIPDKLANRPTAQLNKLDVLAALPVPKVQLVLRVNPVDPDNLEIQALLDSAVELDHPVLLDHLVMLEPQGNPETQEAQANPVNPEPMEPVGPADPDTLAKPVTTATLDIPVNPAVLADLDPKDNPVQMDIPAVLANPADPVNPAVLDPLVVMLLIALAQLDLPP
jgi:hypothetical protein